MTATWRDLTERYLATAAHRRVLLVEDDEVYVERIRQALIGSHPSTFTLEVARTMAQATTLLGSGTFDLVLVDLGLPDEHGARTFERIHRLARPRPVVVISSADDPDLAARLLYLGAQDYLVKGASEDLLMHVIGRAVSRSAPEAGRLPILEPDPQGSTPLPERDPEMFESLVDEYLGVVDASTRRQVLRDPNAGFRTQLRVLVEQLGRGDCSARDALEIHLAAVRRMVESGAPDLSSWASESRLVALELMVQLTEHYRARALDR